MILKFLILSAAVSLGFAVASPALADRNPTPPPSGIVIHLFGQNSVMSNVLPTTGAPVAAHDPAHDAGNGAASPAASTYVEPSASDIIHQMFVTGDPNNPSKPAPGRVADRPAN